MLISKEKKHYTKEKQMLEERMMSLKLEDESHTRPRVHIPTLEEGAVQSILVQQVANMLIEKEEEEEIKEAQQILEEEIISLKLEEKNSVIDIKKGIQTPYNPEPNYNEEKALKNSMESFFKLNFTNCEDKKERTRTREPVPPRIAEMAYIFKKKMRLGRYSGFSKVLTSRLRPVAAPYLRGTIPTNIARFAFTPAHFDYIKGNFKNCQPCHPLLHWDISKLV